LEFIKAYAIIYFDNCFLVRELKVIKGPTGLIVSFPVKKLSDGTHCDIAFPVNAETRKHDRTSRIGGVQESGCWEMTQFRAIQIISVTLAIEPFCREIALWRCLV